MSRHGGLGGAGLPEESPSDLPIQREAAVLVLREQIVLVLGREGRARAVTEAGPLEVSLGGGAGGRKSVREEPPPARVLPSCRGPGSQPPGQCAASLRPAQHPDASLTF